MHWVTTPVCEQRSVCWFGTPRAINYRNITKTNTQVRITVALNFGNKHLLFNGTVYVVATFRKDDDDESGETLYAPLTFATSCAKLLSRWSSTHEISNTTKRQTCPIFPCPDSHLISAG